MHTQASGEVIEWSFTLVCDLNGTDATDVAERLYGSGCGDVLVSTQFGRLILAYDREAGNFAGALCSALREAWSLGVRVIRIEPETMVTASEIAARVGVSRQAVSLAAAGRRGTGFPPPVARVTTSSPLWDWPTVARWYAGRGAIRTRDVIVARHIARMNAWIARTGSAPALQTA